LIPGPVQEACPEIDLANPISLKELTRAATRNLEMRVIMEVLQANGWSRLKTAKWLNISYRSLLYKLDGANILRRPGVYRYSPSAPPNKEGATASAMCNAASSPTDRYDA